MKKEKREQIAKLREERAAKIGEMTEISAKAENESRDLSQSESEKYTEVESELGTLEARIARLEKEEGLAATLTAADPANLPAEERAANLEQAAAEVAEDLEGRASKEYAKAFVAYLRSEGQDAEARGALQVGTNNEGGYTVPTEFLNKLVEKETTVSAIRGLAQVIQTTTGVPVKWPTITTNATGAIVAEEGTVGETEPVFGQATLGAYDYARVALVSRQLLRDSAVDIEGLLAKQLGLAVGTKQAAHFATGAGSGSSEPQGLATGSALGKTAAATSTVTLDELIDLYYSVDPAYQQNGSWIITSALAAILRKLENDTGDKVWQPSLVAGQPDLLLGKPVYLDNNLDTPAASKKIALFGDVEQAYVIRDVVGDTGLQVLREKYAGTLQVGFQINQAADAVVQNSAAVKHLITAAS